MTGRHCAAVLAMACSLALLALGQQANAQGEAPWAHIVVRHPDASELRVAIGCGDPADPIWEQTVWDGYAYGQEILHIGAYLTSAAEHLPPDHSTPWWVEVTDSAAGNAGRIGAFVIWRHGLSYSCTDVPIPIPDGSGSALATITHWSREWENRELISATIGGVSYPGATPPVGPATGPFNISEYFPLDDGNVWCYDKLNWHSYGENPWDVYDTREFDGVVATGIRWQGAETGVRYYTVSSEGLAFYGAYHPEADDEYDMALDAPLVVPNGLNTGDGGSQTVAIYDDDEYLGYYAWSYRLAAVESASAPAGVFENCLRLEFTGEFDLVRYLPTTTPGPWLTTEWYAYGIGIIKRNERVLPPGESRFTDVPMDGWAFGAIDGCANAGIAGGYGDGLYHPDWTVTRDQMAVYLSRALACGDAYVPTGPAQPTFADVPTDHWAYDHIEYAVSQEVVGGYGPDQYAPELAVDRGQMSVFVARAMGWVSIDDDMSTAPELFPDVPAGFWAGTAIQACVENEVVQGYSDGYYHPDWPVTRDQMAVYICRAFRLPMPYNITDYWPLGEGDTWTYDDGGGGYNKVVSGAAELWGRVYARFVHADGFVMYWQAAADGLRHGGSYDPGLGTVTYDPPICILNGLYPGDEARYSTTAYLNESEEGEEGSELGQTAGSFRFVDLADVTVPAGSFEGCMKIEVEGESSPGHANHFYFWAAKDVGKVRGDHRPFGLDNWDDLLTATVGGTPYP